MSISDAEKFLRNARQQVAQHDINVNLLKAAVELTHEIKRAEADIRRVKQAARRRF